MCVSVIMGMPVGVCVCVIISMPVGVCVCIIVAMSVGLCVCIHGMKLKEKFNKTKNSYLFYMLSYCILFCSNTDQQPLK